MNDGVYTRQQYWGSYEDKDKEAEIGNAMPVSTLPKGPDKGAKYTIPKTGSAEKFAAGLTNDMTGVYAKGSPEQLAQEVASDRRAAAARARMTQKVGSAEAPDDNLESPVSGEQPAKNPQAQAINPRVDVSQQEPPKLIKEKQAQYLAMPSIGRYPLDGYDQVKQASVYFEEHRGQFAPEHRREFCVNLVKRASVLCIQVSDEVQKYGSEGYAPASELEIAFGTRRSLVTDETHLAVLDKLAAARPAMDPDGFAITLGEFDKLAGLDEHYDSDVMDPYLSTFGKEAEVDEDASYVIGNDMVTEKQLKELGMAQPKEIQDHFGEDFSEEFKKDPVALFKSLPVDQKKILSRLANESSLIH